MKRLPLFALPLFALAAGGTAEAAPMANLGVSVTAQAGIHVYENGNTTIQVANTGNRNASSVVLTVGLPETHTSPTVHVMGTLTSIPAGCSQSGTTLTCNLGTINKGAQKSVTLNMALPYSAAPLVFDIQATTTTADSNPSNNDLAYVASPLLYDVPVVPAVSAVNRHCTGTNLTSFYECTLYPSSLSSFDSVLEADGTITIVGAPPDTTGEWTQTGPNSLLIEYFDSSGPIGTLDARGVDGNCYEGPMTFPGSSYVALYEVCLD